MVRGGAVSMRWAGRLLAGPDGLAGLRAAVCVLQTVVGQTTINTLRVIECSEEGRKEKRQTRHGGQNSEKKRASQPHLGVWKSTEEEGDDPPPLPHTLSSTRPIYPTHHFVPSLWSELPSHPARRTTVTHRKPPAWPALPLSDALWIEEEITYAFWMHSQWSPFSSLVTVKTTDLGVYTFWLNSSGMITCRKYHSTATE